MPDWFGGDLNRLSVFFVIIKDFCLVHYPIAQTVKNLRDCCHMQRVTSTCQIFLQLVQGCRRSLGYPADKCSSCPFINFRGMSCSWPISPFFWWWTSHCSMVHIMLCHLGSIKFLYWWQVYDNCLGAWVWMWLSTVIFHIPLFKSVHNCNLIWHD